MLEVPGFSFHDWTSLACIKETSKMQSFTVFVRVSWLNFDGELLVARLSEDHFCIVCGVSVVNRRRSFDRTKDLGANCAAITNDDTRHFGHCDCFEGRVLAILLLECL